eukprot:CAMPEP_0178437620 /NCGR_PEP_ID=MMETSP0689_2-20121128/35108_1 /TAXON_ID=160604 /ORGANISM="Amphidinium massartii, Strain CS-259" /LENGTH=103 /DNA_ID=CAMNT_0020059871 /DNA_START=36 /DNA_END=344 /DNA_ORIENTATION=-
MSAGNGEDWAPEGGEVVKTVPLEIFKEGLEARRYNERLLRQSARPPQEECDTARALCEHSFRTMRDAYLVDCRESSKSCNRLRDLIGEVQIACESATKRCEKP